MLYPGHQAFACLLGPTIRQVIALVRGRLMCCPVLHRGGLWKPELLEKAKFTKDLIICQPDVTEIALADGDEFVILATDGLW